MKVLSYRHRRAFTSVLLIALLSAMTPLGTPTVALGALGPVENAAAKAAAWLPSKIEADGGFGNGFSKGSDLGVTADAVLALADAGKAISSVKSKAGKSPLDYFAQSLRSRKPLNAGQYAKMVLALKLTGLNPRAFRGSDLVAALNKTYNPTTGVIGDSVFVHCLGMLALSRTSSNVPAKAITKLETLQTKAGGWAFVGDAAADVDTTALCAEALLASSGPKRPDSVARAIRYLHTVQNIDGGFPYQTPSKFGTESNANSTALVAQLIIASGGQPESWAVTKGNPLSALVRLQQHSGAIAYQASAPDENTLATAGAIPALSRKAFGA